MKRKLLTALVLAFTLYIGVTIGYNLGTPAQATQTAQSDSRKPDVYMMWQLVNNERTSRGLPALKLDKTLNQSAQEKCNDMVKRNYFEHDTPDGKEPWYFIFKHYGDYSTAGENIAYGFSSTSGIVTGWMNSQEHRDNILAKKYDDVGYAACYSRNYVGDGNQYVVVQHFASK